MISLAALKSFFPDPMRLFWKPLKNAFTPAGKAGLRYRLPKFRLKFGFPPVSLCSAQGAGVFQRLSGRSLPLLLAAFVVPIAAPAAPATPPAERIAAVVNNQIIFLTDLERYRTFFEAPEPSPASPQAALQELIDNRLLRAEAHRFLLQAPSDEEVQRRVEAIRRRFKNDAAFRQALRETDFSIDEFKAEVRENLGVEKLLQERVSDFIFVSQKEIERYYEDHAREFQGKKLEEVEPRIRAELAAEKEAAKKKEYLARLRSRAEIEINLQ